MLLNGKSVLLLCALLVSGSTLAQESSSTDESSGLAESQQAAKSLLLEMATQLGSAPKFSVDIRSGYDAVQSTGQKIEFGEQRHLSVERPALLLSEGQSSGGNKELIVFDGKWITISDSTNKVYTRAPQPGDIDATLKYFVGGLGMRMPLAIMLMSQFATELEQRVVAVAYVEETNLLGEPAHHLAGRTNDVDFQIWISSGADLLPLRIILTYREAPGEPQYWANFTNWKLHPSFLLNAFTFKPRADEREVPLAASFSAQPPNTSTTDAPSANGEQP